MEQDHKSLSNLTLGILSQICLKLVLQSQFGWDVLSFGTTEIAVFVCVIVCVCTCVNEGQSWVS